MLDRLAKRREKKEQTNDRHGKMSEVDEDEFSRLLDQAKDLMNEKQILNL